MFGGASHFHVMNSQRLFCSKKKGGDIFALKISGIQYVYKFNYPQEIFNTNISFSHQLFDYKITFVNSQHESTKSKGIFVLKIGFKHLF